MEQNTPFVLQPLYDEEQISVLEYFLQLSFFTTDLHITNSWTFCNDDELNSFKKKSKHKFGGSLVSFLFDMNKLEPPQSFENCSNSKVLTVDYTNQLFEYGTISPPSGFQGNPTGMFRMILFKVALGNVYTYNPESNDVHDDFLKFKIPEGFNTVEYVTNNESKRFNSLYRVSDSSQVLLYAAVEFEFTPLKVQVPDPVCEMCEFEMAKWYCHSDRAHFCNGCDMKQHSSTRIFSRHIRVPCSKSPNQFGLCEQHPTDVVDMVCLKCCSLLCNNCILFGKHSQPSFFDHPLMSTLDTYDLSLEKNSESDEKLKLRRNEISAKIKNRHNSTSQIYANSKGVETKIDYCKKLLLQQLDDMKKKKLNYLNSIEREVNTQLKLIQWMQNFLHHLLLSLEPCQFIMFKKRYDLLVSKYFSKDLKDFLQLPVWMDKELTLVGDARITCSSVNKLSYSFSSTGTTLVNANSIESDITNNNNINNKCNNKLLDWTPLNMYENLNETVGRVTIVPDNKVTNDTTNNSINYKDLSASNLVKTDQRKTAEEVEVFDTATKLWHFLSDFKMGTVIQLLKLVEVPNRGLLVRHVFNLSNHFEQLGPLFTNVANYEMNSLVSDFGYCVLLRSSGLLSEILSFLFCSNFSTNDNLDFLRQLTTPIDHYFNLYLSSSSSNNNDQNQLLMNQQEQQLTDNNTCNNTKNNNSDNLTGSSPVLNELVTNCMVEMVVKLVSLDLLSFPTSFQFVFYTLTDLFTKLKLEYSCYVAVDLFCTVLSNYLLRYLNQHSMEILLLSNNNTTTTTVNNTNSDETNTNEKYNKLKQFTRELSFKFARAAIVVWELDSLTNKDSEELKQSQKMYDWCEKLLVKPRTKSKLLLKTPTYQELDESSNYVLSQVSKFEKRLSSGQVDIPYKKVTELTSKYNFIHLFKMAQQIPI